MGGVVRTCRRACRCRQRVGVRGRCGLGAGLPRLRPGDGGLHERSVAPRPTDHRVAVVGLDVVGAGRPSASAHTGRRAGRWSTTAPRPALALVSLRAIAAATGDSTGTVRNALKPGVQNCTPVDEPPEAEVVPTRVT